jgi:stringent starvation protein B
MAVQGRTEDLCDATWTNLEKKEAMLAALNKGEVFVTFDGGPGTDGLVIPILPSFGINVVTIKLSWKYDPPDLKVDDFGIRSTLSFSGKLHRVEVPWGRVHYMAQRGRPLGKPPPKLTLVN